MSCPGSWDTGDQRARDHRGYGGQDESLQAHATEPAASDLEFVRVLGQVVQLRAEQPEQTRDRRQHKHLGNRQSGASGE